MAENRHIPRLDGVRAVAVLLVLALHVPKAPGNILEVALARIAAAAGQVGVDLFFVLSGFLITGILLDTRGHPQYLRNFYIRRTLRIFPLYYFALALMSVVLPRMGHPIFTPARDQLWFWAYLQDVAFTFWPTVTGPNHFWSLAVEEHFYLIWPFLVWKWDIPYLRRALAGIILLTFGVWLLLLFFGYGTFYFTLARFDGLSLGALLAIRARSGGLQVLAVMAHTTLRWAVVPFAVLYFAVSGSALWSVQVLKSTVIALLLAAVLVLVLTGKPESAAVRVLSSAPLRSIGKYSYAMYVFHPVLEVLAYLPATSFLIRFPLAIGLTWAMARVSWTLVEYPFLRLKSRFG